MLRILKPLVALSLLLPLALPFAAPAVAQAPSEQNAARPQNPGRGGEGRTSERRLPAESVTRHTLELPGRTLRFTATAGALPLVDGNGGLQAEIGYVAYTLDGADRASRPVTFAVNGGPGASSAYLHLLALGPWRLPLDGPTISPSAPPALVPNGETWLDFTDLVFIDPPGTGYSRVAGGDDARQRFYSVDGDVDMLAAIVTRWLKEKDRLVSPKFFAGESYGGFRGPPIAAKLQEDQGVGLSGLVLVSPVLDFGWFQQPAYAPWVHVTRLPSLAAGAAEARGPVSRETLRTVEAYASGEYLTDLMRGLKDKGAVERASARVAEFTGLDPALVRRLAGRVDMSTYQREARRAKGEVVSAYDTGVASFDPEPTSAMPRFDDPVLTAMTAPLTSAILDHLQRTLNYKVEGQRYELLNGSVNGSWRWGNGRGQPESVSELKSVLALDARLRVLITHGFTDLVTPYFASQLLLDQLPDFGPEPRASLKVYPGGHMFYSRAESRRAFRDDVRRLYDEALGARAGAP
ncbi:MAG TPA: peptidase S10 [Microvirga sp.]|jgi:carboxypeptidase C (cathepsin A)|nr:peptidase S10 [Microvirga sp.]